MRSFHLWYDLLVFVLLFEIEDQAAIRLVYSMRNNKAALYTVRWQSGANRAGV